MSRFALLVWLVFSCIGSIQAGYFGQGKDDSAFAPAAYGYDLQGGSAYEYDENMDVNYSGFKASPIVTRSHGYGYDTSQGYGNVHAYQDVHLSGYKAIPIVVKSQYSPYSHNNWHGYEDNYHHGHGDRAGKGFDVATRPVHGYKNDMDVNYSGYKASPILTKSYGYDTVKGYGGVQFHDIHYSGYKANPIVAKAQYSPYGSNNEHGYEDNQHGKNSGGYNSGYDGHSSGYKRSEYSQQLPTTKGSGHPAYTDYLYQPARYVGHGDPFVSFTTSMHGFENQDHGYVGNQDHGYVGYGHGDVHHASSYGHGMNGYGHYNGNMDVNYSGYKTNPIVTKSHGYVNSHAYGNGHGLDVKRDVNYSGYKASPVVAKSFPDFSHGQGKVHGYDGYGHSSVLRAMQSSHHRAGKTVDVATHDGHKSGYSTPSYGYDGHSDEYNYQLSSTKGSGHGPTGYLYQGARYIGHGSPYVPITAPYKYRFNQGTFYTAADAHHDAPSDAHHDAHSDAHHDAHSDAHHDAPSDAHHDAPSDAHYGSFADAVSHVSSAISGNKYADRMFYNTYIRQY